MGEDESQNVSTNSNTDASDAIGTHAADGMMMLPLGAISSLNDDGSQDFAPPHVQHYDDPEQSDVPPGQARVHVAQGFQSLMGNQMDADGVAADVIDAGRDMVLWGVTPSPDAFAVMPDIGDWTDPRAWLDHLDQLDLPANLEVAIERTARAAAARLPKDGEETTRRRFAQAIGDMLRNAGVETLAVRGRNGGFNWIVMNSQDLARESDGEPWAPPGGATNTPDLRDIGVSLGRGGRVQLWPTDAAGPSAKPPTPRQTPQAAAPPRLPTPAPRPVAPTQAPTPAPAVDPSIPVA